MQSKERVLFLLTLVLFALLVVKSVAFDPMLGTLTNSQENFVNDIEQVLDSTLRQGFLYRYGVAKARVIEVEDLTQAESEAVATQTGEGLLMYPYKAKVRKYLLWIIPFGDIRLMK